jgi:hypothetical protein
VPSSTTFACIIEQNVLSAFSAAAHNMTTLCCRKLTALSACTQLCACLSINACRRLPTCNVCASWSRACRADIRAVCAALSDPTVQHLLALLLNDLLHERCTLCRHCWALRRPISSLTAVIPSCLFYCKCRSKSTHTTCSAAWHA